MKKIIGVFVLLLLLTGCTFIRFSDMEYEEIINDTLSREVNLFNNSYNGYNIYIPRGLKVIDKNDYNLQILDSDSTYYLYVDIVSYYYKEKETYTKKYDKLVSMPISYKGKQGYVEVNQIDEKYFVELSYNYAKIQAYLPEKNLKESIYNMIYILSSIKYNDKVINTLIGENVLNYKEEKFDIFARDSSNNNFLEALEKYDTYKEKDEDKDNLDIEKVE